MSQRNILLTVLAVAAAGFAFYNFSLKPKQAEAKSLQTKIDEQQAKLDEAQQLLVANQAAKADFKEDYAQVVRLGKAVPADDDVRSLVVQLSSAAKKSQIDFSEINVGTNSGAAAASAADAASATQLPPGATLGPAGFPAMPFTFGFKGQFFRLGDFFHRLDKFVRSNKSKLAVSGRLLTLDGLKLVIDGQGFPDIKAEVVATSYLVSPLEGATGGATPAGPDGATASGAPTTEASGSGGSESSAPATTTSTSTGVFR